MTALRRCVIRADGAEEEVVRALGPMQIALLLGVQRFARIALDGGWSMYVDAAWPLGLRPHNAKATALAGASVSGPAVVLPDSDFPGGLPA